MQPRGGVGRTALITGASGMLGGEIALKLAEHGWSVRAIVRESSALKADLRLRSRLSLSAMAGLINGNLITALSGDILAENFSLPVGSQSEIDAIIHCAGETSFKNAERCWTTNVGAAQRLIEFARNLPQKPKVFFISTTSVCLSSHGCEVDEDAEFAGHENGYILSKRYAERLLRDSDLDLTIIRPSIVLSRGVNSRRMARSILWVIPVMRSLGETPIDPAARVDMVPADYVADVIVRLLNLGALRYRTYHVSAGLEFAPTCSEIIASVCRADPSYRRIRLNGPGKEEARKTSDYSRLQLLKALDYYAPILNANIVYCNRRAGEELGPAAVQCPRATHYINDLMRQFSHREAVAESANP